MQGIRKLLWIAGKLMLSSSLFLFGGKHSEAAQGQTIRGQTVNWIWPSNGVITDVFGTRKGVHKGIDIAGGAGSPIFAVDDGVVSKSYYSDTYGNVVFIKHKNLFETVYAHLKSRNVTEGAMVKQGDMIGKMGNTGDSSGVHLHFEIHQNEWTYDKQNAIDPILAFGDVKVGNTVAANVSNALEVSGSTHGEIQVGTNPQAKQPVGLDQSRVHVVQAGDTLSAIAKQYGTTVNALSVTNHLHNDKIVQNQRLSIDSPNNHRYVVQQGDTLTSISHKTKTSIENLKSWNQLTSDIIIPKQVLVVQ
ncbi:peptidoglycan DD-metalloendopeptidase family protein [Bacillus sp. T3]|uniref:peptidoglycan DD-metalloendopeptidase family protein n=1 Tax=Bacillus sp. T3 TaxID=467262 RepID=UPI002980E845|nr:peptidoglycan DD-metalloendopeptidase family protein [Bacillus sp. T3]